ncbi:hypothetical protein LI82_07965 [Methanococcoides methylutens]|uniref:Uncharacterized protein n=1 Tax=Methanococcoides methylutens TaxID=2226 RepID=A0A099SXT3_METMT|nr:hypothetical protein [Methanococcoides methylutens]KGK97707.1 hypothetical protein LI82_07965 [Methanococcoides methylutens]
MKRGMMKGFATVAAVLMVVSLLPMTALADTGNGFEDAPGQMKMNATGETVGIQDQDRLRTNYQEAKNDYNRMTSNFQTMKSQQARGLIESEDYFVASQDYLNETINLMIQRLELYEVESQNDDVNETIDDYIGQLELIRVDVEGAETREELSDALKEIRELWKDAIEDMRSFNEMKVGERLDDHIGNTNRISERLQNEIREMEQNGEDVEPLQNMLNEYNNLMAGAESLQEDGEIGDAIKATKEANEQLRKLLQEMKQLREGFVNMAGEGPFNAEGDGTIVLSGQLNVTISATDAMLVIKDLAGDAEIDIKGEYDLVNEEANDGCCAFVYDNFTGDATINGSRITIMIRGEDMTVFAEGSGSASLSGEGSYQIGEGAKVFVTEFAEDEGENEEETDDLGTKGMEGADTPSQNGNGNKPQEV